MALAFGAALATGLLLPGQAFVATSVVGVEGGPSGLRPALIQAAADAAVSRHVMSLAAASMAAPEATGQRPAARTLDRLSSAVRVETGRVPGTLLVRAADGDGERAAAMASAVATALVADLEDRAQETGRAADAAAALRLARLQDTAVTAHRRLDDLGGDVADPAATRAASAARVEALRTRLEAIRAILSASNPPLGAGRDVPPNVDALQTSYLDLTRQLAKARESLGERHTVVIGLQDGIKRTAAELGQAWARLAKATEADLVEARSRAAAATRTATGDAGRAPALAAARIAAQAADEAVAQVQAMSRGDDEARWRVIARAPVPAQAEGLALPIRIAAALAAALLGVALAGLGAPWRRREDVAAAPAPLAAAAPQAERPEPRFFEDETEMETEAVPEPAPAPAASSLGRALTSAPLRRSAEMLAEDDLSIETLPEDMPMDTRSATPPRDTNFDLLVTMARVLPGIGAIAPRDEVPVILVATNEPGVGTMDSVLALGEAAAATGLRVLVVEGGRASPALAAAVEPTARPALVAAFGELRVVLRAETGGGLLYLAPSFRDGAQLAADLERAGDTLVADDLADEFDLVVIDGDRVTDAATLAHHADGVLRIGRFASPRDDERFLATLGTPRSAFLGTVAAAVAVFVPRAAEAPRSAEPPPSLAATLRATSAARPAMRAPFAATRRPAAPDLRRRASLR